MSLTNPLAYAWREHVLAYVLASLSNVILLVPVIGLAARIGQQVNLVTAVGLHQLLIGALVVLLAISGMLPRTWRWQYLATGFLFAGYVAFRMSTRFLTGLELINVIAVQGSPVEGLVPELYLYGLGAAGAYTGMVLVVRRAYGKLVSARTLMPHRNTNEDFC